MTHYNIKKFDSFDFSNKYNVIKKDKIILYLLRYYLVILKIGI